MSSSADPAADAATGDVLSLAGRARLLRRDPRAEGGLADGRRGGDRDVDRGERRRQVDDAPRDQRPQSTPSGLDPLRGPGDRDGRAAHDRQERDRAEPRGAAAVPAHDGHREPRDGCVPAHRPRELPGGHRPCVRAVPAALRAPHAEGRDDVRRRAADVRDRPGADGPPEAAPPRRAVDGAGADLRREDLRDHPHDQRPGHARPARRAERADGARHGTPRLRDGDRPHHARRPRLPAEDERGRRKRTWRSTEFVRKRIPQERNPPLGSPPAAGAHP